MTIAILLLLVAVLAVLGRVAWHLDHRLSASEKRLRGAVTDSEIRIQRLLSTEIGDVANVLVSISEELPKLPVSVIERIETLLPPPVADLLMPVQLPLPYAPPPIPPNPPPTRVAKLILMDENSTRVDHETTIDARRLPRGYVEHQGRKYVCCDKDPDTNTYTYRHIRT